MAADDTFTLRVIPHGSRAIKFVERSLNAFVHVDGKIVGKMDQKITLPHGTHTIQVAGMFGLSSPNIDIRARGGEQVNVLARTTWALDALCWWLAVVPAICLLVLFRDFGDLPVAWRNLVIIVVIITQLSAGALILSFCLANNAFAIAPTTRGSVFAFLTVVMAYQGGRGLERAIITYFKWRTRVYVDGTPLGGLFGRILVTPGVHTVQVRGGLGSSTRIKISFEPEQTRNLRCEPDFGALWPLAVGMLLVAGVGVAVSFVYSSGVPLLIAMVATAVIAIWSTYKFETLSLIVEALHGDEEDAHETAPRNVEHKHRASSASKGNTAIQRATGDRRGGGE